MNNSNYEKIISFETAKKSYQKGFDPIGYDIYIEDVILFKRKAYKKVLLNVLRNWLRDVHNIHILCIPVSKPWNSEDISLDYTSFCNGEKVALGEYFSVLELALNKGLDKLSNKLKTLS